MQRSLVHRIIFPILVFIVLLSSCTETSVSFKGSNARLYLKTLSDIKSVDSPIILPLYQQSQPLKDESCNAAISHEQLRAENELFFAFSDKCDSVKISLPPGGTVTSATLFSNDSEYKQVVARVPSFGILEHDSNYFTIPSTLKGRFFLSYGSCHWGSKLWINFE